MGREIKDSWTSRKMIKKTKEEKWMSHKKCHKEEFKRDGTDCGPQDESLSACRRKAQLIGLPALLSESHRAY